MRNFQNDYNPDGQTKRREARERAGNRCVRCNHPYKCGEQGRGEWSACDNLCTHAGEVRLVYGETVGKTFEASHTVKFMLSPSYRGGFGITRIDARWRVLTVHHLNGDKSNDAWWNTLALCQRCHLEVQGKVDPEIPYFLEHSEWFKPYVAGFYAWKYEGKQITMDEAMARLDELLSHERRA